MDLMEKNATIELDATDYVDEDWRDQLLQFNTVVSMDVVKQNLEITKMESYCNAKEELLNELKLQVTILEGEVNLKLQELNHLQEKDQLITDNLNILNEMIESKEETEDILLENQRLLKAKRERHENQWKQITENYNSCFSELRGKFEKNPLAEQRSNLQIEVQRQRINLAIVKQKVQDEKENIQLLRNIRKRQQQIKIIQFAQIMIDYYQMQNMKQKILVYEKKFKEITENKRKQFAPKEDVFKVPPLKTQNKNDIKSSFEFPLLNLSAYQINQQLFVPNKTIDAGLKSKYSLNKNIDMMLSKLNTNKRNQTFSPQKEKKIKTSFSLSKSLPYPSQTIAPSGSNKSEHLSMPESVKNKISLVPETKEKLSQVGNDATATSDDLFEYISQESVPTQVNHLKSSYFPSTSVSGSSQIISSGGMGNVTMTSSRNNTKTTLEVSEYNDHDIDIMETSSFVSLEEFGSPSGPGSSPGASKDAEHQYDQPNNDTFLNNIFGGANPSQTNINQNSGFSFLNTPSRKKSSQKIFSMF